MLLAIWGWLPTGMICRFWGLLMFQREIWENGVWSLFRSMPERIPAACMKRFAGIWTRIFSREPKLGNLSSWLKALQLIIRIARYQRSFLLFWICPGMRECCAQRGTRRDWTIWQNWSSLFTSTRPPVGRKPCWNTIWPMLPFSPTATHSRSMTRWSWWPCTPPRDWNFPMYFYAVWMRVFSHPERLRQEKEWKKSAGWHL